MVRLKMMGFFCDECGMKLSTGIMCPECKRVLCHFHYYGSLRPIRNKGGLCMKCAAAKKEIAVSEEAQQT